MDESTTPTPTPTPNPAPNKSIDGITSGPKPATAPLTSTPAPAPTPSTPIDINSLDGDMKDEKPAIKKTEADSLSPAAVVPEESIQPENPTSQEPEIPGVIETEKPVPVIKFDAKAAEAAMAEEDKEPEADIPTSLSADSPQIMSSMKKQQPAKKGKGLAIFIAVIIALGLIAGASYAFWKNNQNKKTTTTTTTKTTAPNVSDKVNTASDAIDAELNKIDDTKEFQPNDISDTTLGL